MKYLFIALTIGSFSSFCLSAEIEIKGKEAKKLFKLMEKTRDNTDEGDCGAGHCWSRGEVECQVTMVNKPNTYVCKVKPKSAAN